MNDEASPNFYEAAPPQPAPRKFRKVTPRQLKAKAMRNLARLDASQTILSQARAAFSRGW